jgi:ATP-dependent Clp protease ATP-binding subunit ClpA
MTSNAGAHLIPSAQEMREREEEIREQLMRELQTYFRPEFLNRVDEIIVFHALGGEELKQIAALLLDNLHRTAAEQDVDLRFSEAAIQRIAEEGYGSRYGARPLRRAVAKLIESPLSKEIIAGHIRAGQAVRVDLNPHGDASFEPLAPTSAPAGVETA